jgi:Ca2+ transporting ATPase
LYGENLPVEKELSSIFSMILECFGDTMLQILLIASIVSTGIGIYKEGLETGWTEGATIFFAVFLIVSITVGNNYIKERQFQKLYHKLDEAKVQVIRNSKVQ